MDGVLGAGTTLNDRYLLTERVGGGGMGEVWRATDTVLGRTVAVKVLMPALSEDAAFLQRFQNEARAMATLRHPGVVDVYDYGSCEIGGRQVTFLVMEFVEGESLDKHLRRAALDPVATMRLVAEVADALAAAHAQGIVHRDVKPANLVVRAGGSVALTDFGIAHSASAAQLTATGSMLCSAGYCAPEMATSSEITPAVDVYALGVVAYECLTGRLPYEGDTPVQIIYKHLHAPVPPLPPEVPRGPREVVARALEKAPDRRYASAEDMARAARTAMTSPGAAPAPRRRRAVSAMLATVLAMLVTAGVAAMVWMRPAETAQQNPVLPPASSSEPHTSATATGRPTEAGNQASDGRPTRVPPPAVTGRPSPTGTPTVSPSPTDPPTTPSPDPTTEPEPDPTGEPTDEPSEPDPHEPTQEPTAKPTGDIQCVTTPCP